MPDDMQLMEWETDGGFSPPSDPIACRLCGDDRGPKIRQLEGWCCLVHFERTDSRGLWRV